MSGNGVGIFGDGLVTRIGLKCLGKDLGSRYEPTEQKSVQSGCERSKNVREILYLEVFVNGAPDKIRTCDPYHVKVIL